KLIMLPSETMIWQPEFTDKTLSRKPGAVHNKQLDSAKLYLSRELQAMKELVKEYEDAKKVAMQADIEQLTKISQKYAKAI
ncbi:hypothetical protein LHK92_26695, partial [Escherichia coli]|nr:hypothetical protein [Escherichia coli]